MFSHQYVIELYDNKRIGDLFFIISMKNS